MLRFLASLASVVALHTPYVSPYVSRAQPMQAEVEVVTANAGASPKFTVPAGYAWRILYAEGSFNALGVAGNRIIALHIKDPTTGQTLQFAAPKTQTAGTNCLYGWGPNLTSFVDSSFATNWVQVIALPDVVWPEGTVITYDMAAAQAGDFWGNPSLMLVEVYKLTSTEVAEDVDAAAVPIPAPIALA